MLIAIALAGSVSSQEIPRHVFAAGGGIFEAATVQVCWSIGQSSPIEASSGAGIILTPGFQQFDDQMVLVEEISMKGNFLVYPIPCTDHVQIDIELEHASTVQYTLYDFIGKVLINKKMSSQAANYQELIDLSGLAPGIYNLMLQIGEGSSTSIESIKIIKH